MARPNESELIVPLRNAWNITRFKRAPRAMQIIREQVIRHLKVRKTKNSTLTLRSTNTSGNEALKTHHERCVFLSFDTMSPTSR